MDLVEEKPGILLMDLLRASSLGAGTFYPHLDKLARAGLIETRKRGKTKEIYPAGVAPSDEGILNSDMVKRVARLLVDHGSLTAAQLAREVGVSDRQVRKYLARLADGGYVLSDGNRPPTYAATPPLRRRLE